jgi:hypothetical protein
MKEIFIHIENSLRQRFIISQSELTSFLTRIFLTTSTSEDTIEFKEPVSFQEEMVGIWLLRVFCAAQQAPIRPFSELKTITPIRSVNANILPHTLWQAILEYLSLRERANRMQVSKMWHHLTQHSQVTEMISPIKQINELGMTYLLIYNWRKKCRFLLCAQEPTLESVKQLGLALSSFYILYREEASQKEQLFYASINQFVCLDMEKKNFKLLHCTLRTDCLRQGQSRELSAYELEIMISLTGRYRPRNLLPTIKCLREKMQTALATSNDLAFMKGLRHLNSQSELSRLLHCGFWPIFLQILLAIWGCSSRPPNNQLSQASCYILDKVLLMTLFIAGGLYLLMCTASRNRCARRIEKSVEKITRALSPSSELAESFYRLEYDLKEYAFSSVLGKGIYLWKSAESKTTTPQKIQITVDQFNDQIRHKKGV